MGDVVELNNITRLDIPPGRVLKAAKRAKLTDVVVIGYDSEGEFYFASSNAGGPEVLWLMERARHALMEKTDDIEDGKVPV